MAQYFALVLLSSCLIAQITSLRTAPAGDACASANCPANTQCVEDPKNCFTTPCPQFNCVPINPCHWTKCSSGYVCVVREVVCKRAPCRPVSECVKVDEAGSDGGELQNEQCPRTEGGVSTCDFTDCSKDGCGKGFKCCPKACGGTSCQKPVPIAL